MMIKLTIPLFLILSGCVTAWHTVEVWDDAKDKNLYTLRSATGTIGENLYEGAFEAKAKDTCKNGYDVLEKTRTPATLHKNLYDNHYFNWVIRCK